MTALAVGGTNGGGGGAEQRRVFVGVDRLPAPMTGEIRLVPDDIAVDRLAVARSKFPSPGGKIGRVFRRRITQCGVSVQQRHQFQALRRRSVHQPVSGRPIEWGPVVESLLNGV